MPAKKPKRRNPHAKALSDPRYRPRIVRLKKLYSRKKLIRFEGFEDGS